jgi:division protein 1
VSVENQIEDLEEELELANIGDHHSAQGTEDGTTSDGTPTTEEFMSESIYGKLPKKTNRKRKGTRRKAIPVLHEHLEPGHHIKEIQTHSDSITALDFDVPFGTMVTASVDDSCKVWDLNSGKCLGVLEGHQASVRCLQVEDSIVATGSADASIRIWDLSRAESYKYIPGGSDDEDGDGSNQTSMADCHVMTLGSHVDEVTALYFQGDMLVSGSADKTLRQWDLEKGRCVQTLDVLWAAAQSSMDEGKWRTPMGTNEGDFIGALQCFDAALACGTADGMVRLWDCMYPSRRKVYPGHERLTRYSAIRPGSPFARWTHRCCHRSSVR